MSGLDAILKDVLRLNRQELKFLMMRLMELLEEMAANDAQAWPAAPSPAPPSPADDDIPMELLMRTRPAVELDEEMADEAYLQGVWPATPES